MDVFHVMIECPNTGRATRTGVEIEDLDAFAYVALRPESVQCEHCHESHVWTHKDAWAERRSASRIRVRPATPTKPVS